MQSCGYSPPGRPTLILRPVAPTPPLAPKGSALSLSLRLLTGGDIRASLHPGGHSFPQVCVRPASLLFNGRKILQSVAAPRRGIVRADHPDVGRCQRDIGEEYLTRRRAEPETINCNSVLATLDGTV